MPFWLVRDFVCIIIIMYSTDFDQYKQRHRPIKRKLRPAFNAVGDFRDVVWRFEVGLAHSDLGHIQGDSVVYASLGFHGRGSCAFGRTPSTAGIALACACILKVGDDLFECEK